MTAIAAGASAFLVLAGGIMLAIGLVGSFKLIWSKAGAQIVAHFAPILSTFGVVTAVIAGIAGLAFVVYRNWNTLKPHFTSILRHIRQVFSIMKGIFSNFAQKVSPIVTNVFEILEIGILVLLNIILPILDGALMILAGILNGNVVGALQNVWNSCSTLGQILLVVLSPVIAILTGRFVMMTAAMVVNKGIILAVSAATKIWAGVQWILNAATLAFPGNWIILALITLGVVIISIVANFKKLVEWVQKGWDKLKNFLGFKREHKDELEAPIETEITQTESIEKQVSVTANKTGFMQNLNTDVSRYIQKGMDGMELTPEILLNPEYQVNVAENQKKMQSIMEAMSFSFVGKGFGDMKQKISEQFADVKTSVEQNFDFANMNYTMPDVTGDLQEVTNMMQTGGTDAGNAFADALSGTGGNVQSAIQSINSIIESTLLNKEQMYLWGSNLMQSFINGMNSQKVNLMTTAATLAITIGDYLKVQSPSRKGELKTNHLWGGNLIKSFAEGMKKEQRLLKNTTAILAEQTGGLQNSIRMENWNSEGIGRYHRKTEKREEKETEQRPIYIVIQGAEKRENEIAQEVARELDKRGYGKKKREKSPSLTMSPYKILGGY